jgi:hypothetical protein
MIISLVTSEATADNPISSQLSLQSATSPLPERTAYHHRYEYVPKMGKVTI